MRERALHQLDKSVNGFTVAALLVCVLSPLSGWQESDPRDFQVSFKRRYGRSHFSSCRLDMVVHSGKANASLRCIYSGVEGKGRPISPLTADETLISAEATRLIGLVARSALYDGEHVGLDATAIDGHFETLEVRRSGRTVVLVTSGNPSFTQNASRKELLSVLMSIEQRLLNRAKTQTK
jgi:hypothetical protein